MNDSPTTDRRRLFAPALRLATLGVCAMALQACGGPGDPDLPDQQGIGLPNEKPGSDDPFNGGSYIVDPHGGGVDTEVFVEELFWGRLVNVFDFDGATGQSRLVFPELVIGQEVRTEPGRWTLETDAVTGTTQLTILKANTSAADDAFDFEVQATQANLVPVLAKGTSTGETPPFSLVARNSALVVRFSDLIDPDTVKLGDTVRVLVGAPPTMPFEARVLPDQNFGGIAANQDAFFSTRLILDFTVSKQEQTDSPVPIATNGLGLPASLLSFDATAPAANVAVKFPTQAVPAIGQFNLLTNLKGEALSTVSNGPIDLGSLSTPVTRAFRSGNSSDINNGFLADLEAPNIIGSQPITILSAADDPNGNPGYDFVVELQYANPACGFNPTPGDLIVTASDDNLTVDLQSTTINGIASGVRVTAPLTGPAKNAVDLTGVGVFRTVLRQDLLTAGFGACFLRFSPAPPNGDINQVATDATIIVEFSEPMDPSSGRPFDSFQVTKNLDPIEPTDWIVGEVRASSALSELTFDPTIELPNPNPAAPTTLVVSLTSEGPGGGLRDLAGNALALDLPPVIFGISPTAQPNNAQGYAVRFSAPDEILVDGGTGIDWRGQFTYDLSREEIRPRPVNRFSATIDDVSTPLVGQMQQLNLGLQTPLSNLGSKAHLMWRYADMGYTVSNFEYVNTNLDVEGVAFSPQAGSVVPTNYEQFQMSLGHSTRMPDEIPDPLSALPVFRFSGFKTNAGFTDNFLNSSVTEDVTIVHERNEGFIVSNLEVFQASTGTSMLYMPMNRNKPISEFRYMTWRDTAIQARGAFKNNSTLLTDPDTGIPFQQEVTVVVLGAPEDQPGSEYDVTADDINDVGWAWGNVVGGVTTSAGIPSVGLPLLMEYRCYPSEALSLNNLRASIAITSSAAPFFRAFSTGGYNQGGNEISKDPDTEPSPTGGFNGDPMQPPIGKPTLPRDPTVYYGQADFLVRVSRVYSQAFAPDGSLNPAKDYVAAVLEPLPQFQPLGTSIEIAYRGTGDDRPAAGDREIKSENLDIYGDIREDKNPEIPALNKAPWSTSIDSLDGQRGFQLRLTFISNPVSGLSPTLSSIGMAYRAQ